MTLRTMERAARVLGKHLLHSHYKLRTLAMCIFCAAIPVTLAMGARLNVKQKKSQKIADSQGHSIHHKTLPVGPLTIIAVTGLAVSSVIYHSHLGYW